MVKTSYYRSQSLLSPPFPSHVVITARQYYGLSSVRKLSVAFHTNMGAGGFDGVGHPLAAACLRRLAQEIPLSSDKRHRAIESLAASSRFVYREPYKSNAALQSFTVPMNPSTQRCIAKPCTSGASISRLCTPPLQTTSWPTSEHL